MQYLIVVAVLSGFIALYIFSLYLNSRIEIPESCKEAYLEAQACESCASRASGKVCGYSEAIEFMKGAKL